MKRKPKSSFSEKEFLYLKRKLEIEKEFDCEILSNSMQPLISKDDIVQIVPVENFGSLKLFDVIVFFSSGILICHYFIKICEHLDLNGNQCVNTKGLRSDGLDIPVPTAYILGVCPNLKIPFYIKIKEAFRLIFHL